MIPLLQNAQAEGTHGQLARTLLHAYRSDVATRSGRAGSVAVPGTNLWLTERESDVLNLIATGASNRDIADKLVITERTVKSHITEIFSKLGVDSRTQAAARARELSILG
jgi:ATP/maltotriose-dependent transcriptional regulator MalT